MLIDEYPEFVIGLLRPRLEIDAIVDRLLDRPGEASEVGASIAGNRCLLIAHPRLEQRTDDPRVGRVQQDYLHWLGVAARRREEIRPTLDLLDQLGKELGLAIWGIKGLASRVAYEDPDQRQVSDADVAVATRAEAFVLAQGLRRHGFVTDATELPWIKETLDGASYGQYRLLPPEGLLAVDIHFGPGYSAGHAGLLTLPAPASVGIRALPIAANLGPMLGNSGGDAFITTKDVNDLWVAAGLVQAADVDALVAQATSVGMVAHLRNIARVALEVTALEGHRLEMVSRVAGSSQHRDGPIVLASRNRPVGRIPRAVRTATVAYQQARSLQLSPSSSIGVAAQALAYYTAPLALRVAPMPGLSPRPAPWRCVRLVPPALAVEGERWAGDAIEESRIPAQAGDLAPVADGSGLWQSGDAVFVPTVWYVLPRSRVKAGLSRSARIRSSTVA